MNCHYFIFFSIFTEINSKKVLIHFNFNNTAVINYTINVIIIQLLVNDSNSLLPF